MAYSSLGSQNGWTKQQVSIPRQSYANPITQQSFNNPWDSARASSSYPLITQMTNGAVRDNRPQGGQMVLNTGSSSVPFVPNTGGATGSWENGSVLGKSASASVPNPQSTFITHNGETKKLADWMGEGVLDQYGNSFAQDRQRAEAEATARADATRNTIRGGFSDIRNQLDGYLNQLSGYQNEDINSVGNSYNYQNSEIANQRNAQINKLNSLREGSIADLQKTMRTMLDAGNIKLGAAGAGDSSATPMYAYALSKQATQNQSNIQNQSNQQMMDIETNYNSAINSLNQWKEEQVQGVRSKYQSLFDQVQQRKMSATAQETQALANLETGLLNQAQSELANIKAMEMQNRQSITQWALQQSQSVNQYRQGLDNSVVGINSGSMQGLGDNVRYSEDEFYNPYTLKKGQTSNK